MATETRSRPDDGVTHPPAQGSPQHPEAPAGAAAWTPPAHAEPPLAAVWQRLVAGLIDVMLLFLLLAAFIALFGGDERPAGGLHIYFTAGDSVVALSGWPLVGYVGACFALLIAFEAATGRTPGKLALRMRVLRADGGRIGFWQAVGRNLLRAVDGLVYPFYLVGIVVVASTKRRQRVGDLAARTIVVKQGKEG